MLLVFDLDGTLVDSVRDLAASASELATGLGGRALNLTEVAEMVGDGAGVLVRRALAAAGVEPDTPGALQRFLTIYDRRLLDTTVPYAGVDEALRLTGRRGRMAVLTNKPLAPARRILDALGLTHYFFEIIGGDGPLGRKPDPRGLQSLAQGMRTVMLIGDSPIDSQTAAAAGCSFAWARYGFGAARFDERPPDTPYVLNRPADLAAALDRFSAVMTGA